MTSRQAVDVVQRLARPAKAGHAGTLDPLASGVLVVCVGGATRLIEYVQRMPKRYLATFLLGRQSPTEDIEGEVVLLPNAPVPTAEQIAAAAQHFVGRIEQRPPAFSALKIRGRPAYKLARQGQPVELKPRPVEIYRIGITSYQYPELVLEVECGGGTYIRSLGRDLAESLGTAAVMSALVRTAIGSLAIEESVDPRELTGENWLKSLHPPLQAVECLPQVQLSGDETTRVRNGLTIELRGEGGKGKGEGEPLAVSPEFSPLRAPTEGWSGEGQGEDGVTGHEGIKELAAVDATGQLVGILVPAAGGQWRPLRNLPVADHGSTR
jgi:tRNA pseudouridine55 synthase